MSETDSFTSTIPNTDNLAESDALPESILDLLITVAMSELQSERERSNDIDTKSGIFISGLIALLALYILNIPFSDIKASYASTAPISKIITIALWIMAIGVILLIFAFGYLYFSFMPREFKNIKIVKLNEEKSKEPDLIERVYCKQNKSGEILTAYREAIKENSKFNNKKADALEIGLRYSMVSFVLLTISTVILLIVC